MEHAADTKAVWLHESALEGLLEKHQTEDRQHVRDVLDKARSLSGLSLEDVAVLMAVHSQDLLDELFHTAKSVKEEIYGNRIVLLLLCTFPTSVPMSACTAHSDDPIKR